MTIDKQENGTTTTLFVEGRIDTNTSPMLQDAILSAFQGAQMLELDFTKVAYISSSGLRALLIGQKTAASKGAKMELLHISPMVQEILDTVGFTDFLTIR